MEFKEAIDIIKKTLNNIGGSIKPDDYDGIIVKRLESSNTLDEGRKTKQYHIAITGSQMDFFPYIRADGYFNPPYEDENNDLKKYFVAQIPVSIYNDNISYMTDGQRHLNNSSELVNVSIVRSRRKNETDQIQMSMTYLDSPEFVDFRRMIHTGSYIIMLKYSKRLVYDMFAVKENDANKNGLDNLNNCFFMLPTNTPVPLKDVLKESKGNYNSSVSNIIDYSTSLATEYSLNRIIFGAPGTGKSHMLEDDKKNLLKNGGDYERVTFHPDYTYSKFVGTYKPVSDKDNIDYEFVPGPFVRILVKAIKSIREGNPKPYLLLIEEINRAPVAAVFGDVFQLLDREDNGVSQYEIETSEDLKKYLAGQLNVESEQFEKIKIPNNMFIWATMNSADQGVFPMDTAFKRRWDFTYLGIDMNDKDLQGKKVTVGSSESQTFEWNRLRQAINRFLSDDLKVNEDKQLGPYFLSRSIVVPDGDEIDPVKFADAFKNKVLMYLFEDAARQRRNELFDGVKEEKNRYSHICDEFDRRGINIFNQKIVDAVPLLNSQKPADEDSAQ